MWPFPAVLALLISGGSGVRISGSYEVRVESGTSVTLTCVGDGHLVWLHNGTRVIESNHTHSPREGVLVVTGVTAPDAGLYTCSNGSSSHSIRLTVGHGRGGDSLSGFDRVRGSVVGGVIGLGSLVALTVLIVLAVISCTTNKHRVNYEDEMQYILREKYTASLNMEALERLPPEMRAVMDLDFLARLTNTDPALLQKYKVEPRPSTDEQVETIRGSPSYISLGSVHVDLVKQAKPSDRPVTPVLKRPSTYITTPNSPALSLHHQVSTAAEEEDGDKQQFLRMLKMVESVDRDSASNLDQSLSGQ